MSVIPLKGDIHQRGLHVRLVPIADIWLFVRVYSQWAYGIPPEQVVGTAGGTKYSYDTDGKPILTKEPKLLLNDNDALSELSMVATTSPTASSLVRYWTALSDSRSRWPRCWRAPLPAPQSPYFDSKLQAEVSAAIHDMASRWAADTWTTIPTDLWDQNKPNPMYLAEEQPGWRIGWAQVREYFDPKGGLIEGCGLRGVGHHRARHRAGSCRCHVVDLLADEGSPHGAHRRTPAGERGSPPHAAGLEVHPLQRVAEFGLGLPSGSLQPASIAGIQGARRRESEAKGFPVTHPGWRQGGGVVDARSRHRRHPSIAATSKRRPLWVISSSGTCQKIPGCAARLALPRLRRNVASYRCGSRGSLRRRCRRCK